MKETPQENDTWHDAANNVVKRVENGEVVEYSRKRDVEYSRKRDVEALDKCLDAIQLRFNALWDAWRVGDNNQILDVVRKIVAARDDDVVAEGQGMQARLIKDMRELLERLEWAREGVLCVECLGVNPECTINDGPFAGHFSSPLYGKRQKDLGHKHGCELAKVLGRKVGEA